MNRLIPSVIAILLSLTSLAGAAPVPDRLDVTLPGIAPGGTLPLSSAYCVPPGMPADSYNISPAVSWSPGPPRTKSYALLMSDLDVPKDLSLMNKPGVTLTQDTPRMPLSHWVLVDIPPTVTHLDRGVESDGFVPKGKPLGPTAQGLRGANAYSHFYPDDSPLAGPHGGYDGPCPPKNDLVRHRYVLSVYALDIESLGLGGLFFSDAALERMQGHILAQGQVEALYGP